MTDVHHILILTAAIVLTAVVTALLTIRKTRRKVSYMLDALEDKELNFRFDEKRLFGRKFNRTLNRLRNIFDKERHDIMEQERFYGQMLDHVQTGVIVIESDKGASSLQEGRVIYCNSTALNLLGLATFSHIRQLRTISPALEEAFRNVSDNREERAEYYNESGQKRISLTASSASIGGKDVKVVAFNDISVEMAENEQESWTRLIRRNRCGNGPCRECDNPRHQQRTSDQQGKSGRDLRTVLHHKAGRHGHRPQSVPSDNASAQRYTPSHPQRHAVHRIHSLFPMKR